MKETVTKLQETPNIQIADIATLLRYASRQLSIKGGDSLAKKVSSNEELRKNITIIAAEAEKVIDQVPASLLPNFANLINVFRIYDLEGWTPNTLRSKIVNRARLLFSDKLYELEVKALSFEQLSKLLSDLVHYGNMQQIANRLNESLPKLNAPKKDGAEPGQGLKDLVSIVRLLDSISTSSDTTN